MGSSSLPTPNNSHLLLCTKGEINCIFALRSAVCSRPKSPTPNMPFLGRVSRCAPAGSPQVASEVLPPVPCCISDTPIFAHCSKGAQLHTTCASVPCLLPCGRKNRCNFKLPASQLLGEKLEVSGGKEGAAQRSRRPVFSWFYKVLLQNCIQK